MVEKKRGRPPKKEDSSVDSRNNRMVVRLGDVAYRRLGIEAGIRKCSPSGLAVGMLANAIDETWPECEEEAMKMFESIFEKR